MATMPLLRGSRPGAICVCGHQAPVGDWASRFCVRCGWPLLQPCPYADLGCGAELPLDEHNPSTCCTGCSRPLAYGAKGRAYRLGALDDGSIRSSIAPWPTDEGPGGSRFAAMSFLPTGGPTLRASTAVRAPGPLRGIARAAGSLHLLFPNALHLWNEDGSRAIDLGLRVASDFAAADWITWVRTDQGLLHVDTLNHRVTGLNSRGRPVDAGSWGALLVDTVTLEWFDPNGVSLGRHIFSQEIIHASANAQRDTVVVLVDGSVIGLSPNGGERLVLPAGGRVARVTRSGDWLLVFQVPTPDCTVRVIDLVNSAPGDTVVLPPLGFAASYPRPNRRPGIVARRTGATGGQIVVDMDSQTRATIPVGVEAPHAALALQGSAFRDGSPVVSRYWIEVVRDANGLASLDTHQLQPLHAQRIPLAANASARLVGTEDGFIVVESVGPVSNPNLRLLSYAFPH